MVNLWKLLRKKKMISIQDIDDLMDQVEKVLQNMRNAEESRDRWRMKYNLLIKEIKDGHN